MTFLTLVLMVVFTTGAAARAQETLPAELGVETLSGDLEAVAGGPSAAESAEEPGMVAEELAAEVLEVTEAIEGEAEPAVAVEAEAQPPAEALEPEAATEAPAALPYEISEAPAEEPWSTEAAAEEAVDEPWSTEAAAAETSRPGVAAVEGEPAAPAAGIGAAAYDELIRENLELRRQIDAAMQSEADARQRNEQMAREVRDLEQKIQDMAGLVESLKTEKAAPADAQNLADIESRLTAAEAEKLRLQDALEATKAQLEAASAAAAATPAPAEPVVTMLPPAAPAVAPGSDLFQEVEKENVLLKQKLEMLQADQQKAAGAVEKQRELEAELARAKAGEQQSREAVEKLLERIPELEDQLAALKSGTQQQDAAITVKDKDLSAFKLELERRENRLIKAERMATLLAKTREEIKQVSDREKRDMHYNMAAVYAKEGKYREAEQEYLRALRIDPGDADSHYNLGILYDEQLADKRRAAMHYRRYLKLRPNASDGDIVKTWLMDLDMGRR